MAEYDKTNCIEHFTFSKANDDTGKDVIRKLIEDWDDNDLYKGIKNRKNLGPKGLNENNGKELREILKKRIEIFKKYIKAFKEVGNDVDILITLQHYGGETNLIDFTYNPLVALFFSLAIKKDGNEKYEVIKITKDNYTKEKIKSTSEEKSDNGNCLFVKEAVKKNCCNPESLCFSLTGSCAPISSLSTSAKISPKDTSDSSTKLSFVHVNDIIDYEFTSEQDKVFILEPFLYTNLRIFNQQGVFAVTSYKKSKEENFEFILKNAIIYTIEEDLRDEVLSVLKALGIDEAHLFPDVNGLVNHVMMEVK